MEESVARERVSTARRLMSDGKTAAHAAKTVGWSKATLYRYLKTYGDEPAAKGAVVPKRTGSRSRYTATDTLPPRGTGR
jgi:hypothetical protein